MTINGQSGGILPVLVFGAGTDYALLLVARYREELRRHDSAHEAMQLALRTAGPAIFFSGLTVMPRCSCCRSPRSTAPPASGRSARWASRWR